MIREGKGEEDICRNGKKRVDEKKRRKKQKHKKANVYVGFVCQLSCN